jgi:hypothetical protein
MAEQPGDLVTIATFATAMNASLARGALEAIGIQAFIPGEDLGSFSRNRGGVTNTTLQVRHADCVRAIAELQRLDPGALIS